MIRKVEIVEFVSMVEKVALVEFNKKLRLNNFDNNTIDIDNFFKLYQADELRISNYCIIPLYV